MGYMSHNAIIVTAAYDKEPGLHWIEAAYEQALEIFEPVEHHGLGASHIVGFPTDETMNGYRSMLIAPDGSKEGWDMSNKGDEARANFIQWMREQTYEDASSPLSWVEVQYDNDDWETKIVDDSHADRRTAFPEPEDYNDIDTTLVVKVNEPSDELRMTLDDVLTDFGADFTYVTQLEELDPIAIKQHVQTRLAGFPVYTPRDMKLKVRIIER